MPPTDPPGRVEDSPVGRRVATLFPLLRRAELVCQTREEAEQLAGALTELLPGPIYSRLGLTELLLNAIEHGNLEIGGAHKARLLREGRFDAEIAARLARPPYRARRVHVSLAVDDAAIVLEIRDDGAGFDWRAALAAELTVSDAPNGRGIALARLTCFPELSYRDPGNVAIVTLPCPR
jgi:hypothetical protein